MTNTEIHALDHTPSLSDFIPLSNHQEQTPTTFFHARPVLHYTLDECDLLVSTTDLSRHPFLRVLGAAKQGGVNGDAPNGTGTGGVESLHVVRGVKGFVTSEALVLSQPSEIGAVCIPYPSISLHATQRVLASTSTPRSYHPLTSTSATSAQETQALYLQLSPSNPNERDPATDEDDEQTLELFLVPQNTDAGEGGNGEQVTQIFEALSRCADLHPDTGVMGGDEDDEGAGGGLAAALGGFGGGQWITSENMHEFEGEFGEDDEDVEEDGEEEEGVDQDGQNGVQSGLGPGAGTRRGREEHVVVEGGDVEGGDIAEETKWQRTGN